MRYFLPAILLLVPSLVLAQAKKKDGPPPPPAPSLALSPQAPTIVPATPFGMTRGTTLEITLAGTKLQDAVDVWTSFPSKATITAKTATEVKAKLEVPADAPIGYHRLRVLTKQGISNAVLFCIDDLPQVLKKDGNQDKKTPQVLTPPCVVVGRIDEEKSDWYQVTAKAGERIAIEAIGRRLGLPTDPILKLYTAKNGREIPGTYSDDPPCLQSDARIAYTFPESGDYLIEIRDTQYRGGKDYHYRLRIGDFPVGLVPNPLVVQAGSKTSILFPGATLPELKPFDLQAPATAAAGSIDAIPKSGSQAGWPLSVAVSDLPQLAEKEPNNSPEQAMQLPVPCGVSAGFQTKRDVDFFKFPAKKGTKYVAVAEAYTLNSPADVNLEIWDKSKKAVAKGDPMQVTAKAEFTATEDGDLWIRAEHLNYLHGPGELYYLTIQAETPDFDLLLPFDRCESAKGGSTLFPVTILRKGYTGEIKLAVEGPAGVSGSVIVPAGVNSAVLPVAVAGDASKGAYPFFVRGEATVNGSVVRRYGDRFEEVRKEMNGLPFPPRRFGRESAVGIVAAPLKITAKLDQASLSKAKPTELKIEVEREKGAEGEIKLEVVGLPENVTAAAKTLAKDVKEANMPVAADAKAVAGRAVLAVRATIKLNGQDYVFYSPLIETVVAK